jgi:predicted phage-related endonuclease
MIERIPIDPRNDRAAWLALRGQDMTASVIGALHGLHPYTSRLRLYKEKTGFEFPDEQNVRMRRGLLLESAIAARVNEERPDWQISPAGVYLRDPGARLGATPDFFVDGDPRGRGVLQTKLTMSAVFKSGWMVDGEPQVPMWIRLQTLTEMMLADAPWGAVGVWLDDPYKNECYIFEIERHAGAEAQIRADVANFWQDVEWQIEPEVDGRLDSRLVELMYPQSDPLIRADLTGDNYLPEALAERATLKARIAEDQERVDEIETELKGKMGVAELALLNGFTITFKTIHRKAYEVKAGSYRKLNITDTRPQEIIADGEPTRY